MAFVTRSENLLPGHAGKWSLLPPRAKALDSFLLRGALLIRGWNQMRKSF